MSERAYRQALLNITDCIQRGLSNKGIELCKEVKEILDHIWNICEDTELRNQNPDMVVLLRWANESRAHYLDQVALTHDCQRDVKFYRGKAGMAAEVQGYCQQFVRLTDDDGWEWVKEE